MSSYPPDPACAAELEQATTPDAKRAILEKHGWTCDTKGDRWTYRKGDGRVIKSLTTLVKELSNDDPFASGSDDDDAKDEHDQEHNREITREDISVEVPEHAHRERREECLAYRTEGLAKSEGKVRHLTRACTRTKARTLSPCSS